MENLIKKIFWMRVWMWEWYEQKWKLNFRAHLIIRLKMYRFRIVRNLDYEDFIKSVRE